jgi:hypothetical protein
MHSPYRLSNISSHIDITEVLNRHGYTSEGYDNAISEIVKRTQDRVGEATHPNDIEAEAQNLVYRLVLARTVQAQEMVSIIHEFLQTYMPQDVDAFAEVEKQIRAQQPAYPSSDALVVNAFKEFLIIQSPHFIVDFSKLVLEKHGPLKDYNVAPN